MPRPSHAQDETAPPPHSLTHPMELLNLTLGQLLAVLLPAAALITALYFYDRSRRRVLVSTTRFFPPRVAPPVTRRQRKLQQPWSWLLQLLALILLVLAIADWRINFGADPRAHILAVDASAAMQGAAANGDSLLSAAQTAAKRYLGALPAGDAVMLLRLDGAPTPLTPFTSERATLVQAIDNLQAGWTSANIPRTLDIATAAMDWAREDAATPGEIALVTPGYTLNPAQAPETPKLRWIPLEPGGEDRWIAGLRAERDPEDPERWTIVALAGHDSPTAQDLTLEFRFAGQSLGAKRVLAPADADREIAFRMTTPRAGTLEALLRGDDRNPINNRAQLHFPAAKKFAVAVVSEQPNRFDDLLTASRYVEPVSVAPDDTLPANADLVLYDGQAPTSWPAAPAILLAAKRSSAEPAPAPSTRWQITHSLSAGLERLPLDLPASFRYAASEAETIIAESAGETIALLDESAGHPRLWIGWDLTHDDLAGSPATPIFFANILNQFLPGSFPPDALHALAPGGVELAMTPIQAAAARVVDASGSTLASFARGAGLQFFRAQPAQLRVLVPGGSRQVSLTLPAAPGALWQAPDTILRGVPPAAGPGPSSGTLWRWLALLALALLIADWFFFGRPYALHRRPAEPASPSSSPPTPSEDREMAEVRR